MELIIAIGVVLVLMMLVLLTRPVLRPFHLGYQATPMGTVLKDYDDVTVSFYSWEIAPDNHREMTDGLAEGVYAIVASPRPLRLDHVSILFDEVEIDTRPGNRYASILKKKGVYIGEPEMKKFLELFERELVLDLSVV
jgi:hypothetical protein